MPDIKVKCTVADCFFHAVDDLCGADQIEIKWDERLQDQVEVAQEFDLAVHTIYPVKSKDTCCKTFRVKV